MVCSSILSITILIGSYDSLNVKSKGFFSKSVVEEKIHHTPNVNQLYVSIGGNLSIYNDIVPSNPALLGEINVKSNILKVTTHIYQNYRHVILSSAYDGIQIWNVINPSNPVKRGTYDPLPAPHPPYGPFIKSFPYLYLVINRTGFRVVNIANPDAPYEVGNLDLNYRFFDIAISPDKKYIYTACDTHLITINISDSSNPYVTKIININSNTRLTVSNSQNILYVNSYINGFGACVAYDISDPSNPIEIGTITFSQYRLIKGLKVVDTLLYVLWEPSPSIDIINVSNPANPSFITTVSLDSVSSVYFLSRWSNYLYVSSGEGGFSTIDITDPTNPFIVFDRYDVPGHIKYSIFRNNHLYLLSSSCFKIYDIMTDQELGTYRKEGPFFHNFDLKYPYVYIVSDDSGMYVLDISDSMNIQEVSHFFDPESLYFGRQIRVEGDYAYISAGKYLRIIDISDPLNPYITGSYMTSEINLHYIDVLGNYVYAGTFTQNPNATLEVINVSDPSYPFLEGECNIPGSIVSIIDQVCVLDNYVYIANRVDGLKIVNVSNPPNPFVEYTFSFGGRHINGVNGDANSIYVYVADYAFTSLEHAYIKVFDVSSLPPVETGNYTIPYNFGIQNNVYAFGETISAAYSYGAIILENQYTGISEKPLWAKNCLKNRGGVIFYDIAGRKIKNIHSPQRLNFEKPKGIYFFKSLCQNHSIKGKIIIIK